MADQVADRRAQMFPTLTPAQIARVAAVGTQRHVRKGDVAYQVGDRNTSFFVVVAGELEVVRPVAEGEAPVVVYGPGQFTGEINMLSARRSLTSARATQDGELIEVERERLRTLVQRDPELSEILLRAFILRRVKLIAQETSGLVPRHSEYDRFRPQPGPARRPALGRRDAASRGRGRW